MGEITGVRVDLVKHVIQVHAANAAGRAVIAKALAREKFAAWCTQLSAGCLVAMEACSGAHHWARKLRCLELDARLIAADFVVPCRTQDHRGKNGAIGHAGLQDPALHRNRSQICRHRPARPSLLRPARSSLRSNGGFLSAIPSV